MQEILVTDAKDFRAWLKANHKKEDRVFVVKYKKHTGHKVVPHLACMKEAICFGWIDTTVKTVDDDKYGHTFVKRKPNAGWSENTLKYAKEMIAKRKMTKAGLEAYKRALLKSTPKPFPKVLPVPKELQAALNKNKKAKENFANLAPSYKRIYIIWLLTAKLPETKQKRIKEIVQRSKQNKKWGE